MKRYYFVLAVLVVVMTIASCKKSDDFVNPVFMCECGSLSWEGEVYPLLMAEYVLLDSNQFSRKYFLTADVRSEDEVLAHNLNFSLTIDSISGSMLFVPDESLSNMLQVPNLNDNLSPLRNYTGVNGVINVNSQIFSGSESISFDLEMKEIVNGDTVGLVTPFSGSFSLTL